LLLFRRRMDRAIRVAIRVRPLSDREVASNCTNAWQVQEVRLFQCDLTVSKRAFTCATRRPPATLCLVRHSLSLVNLTIGADKIFDTDECTRSIYNGVARDIIQSCLQGMNGMPAHLRLGHTTIRNYFRVRSDVLGKDAHHARLRRRAGNNLTGRQ
jgi:hypothetical protein